MKKRQYWFGLIIAGIFLAVALVGLRVGVWHQAAESAKPVEGYPAPNFTLPDLNGRKVVLKNIIARNKVTVINFWATWCPPCRAEIPELKRFYRKYSSRGMTVLAIDLQEKPGTVSAFARKNAMNFPVLTDTTGKIGNLYQVLSLPNTFILDQKGTIRAVIKGGTNLATLDQKVQPLLKQR
jgi:cytochrome c biogenesis protein CcmG/thiol:disulfide interchange protein DsbE